jgi:hypothetical protein
MISTKPKRNKNAINPLLPTKSTLNRTLLGLLIMMCTRKGKGENVIFKKKARVGVHILSLETETEV